MERLLNRGWGLFLPVCGEFVGFPRGATPVARASPPDWPRTGGGGALSQWDCGSENAGMKVICRLYYIEPMGLCIEINFQICFHPVAGWGIELIKWRAS